MYYYRRFYYTNPKVLFLLHIVSYIKKIIILKRIPLYKTYSYQKIYKTQSKTLAQYKKELLELISFNITSLFSKSYQGYRYFKEIINNQLYKTQTLLLKDRKEILLALYNQKQKYKLETRYYVKTAYTDNALKILEVL